MRRLRETMVIFTTLLSGLEASSNRCYVCTTIDANAMLKEIADPNWLRWLENVRYAPYSEQCADKFKTEKFDRNLEVCTCGGNLCNDARNFPTAIPFLIVILFRLLRNEL
ncbi:unnamed protein product [Strongylus vulgaris]|uniref:Protein quiver n=1 Tax=Strongylus vulgaris TaxID=40348 RepID=A0A3P7LNE1_STRVU|nr:unnamed protein product [Strongylus vulgaris]